MPPSRLAALGAMVAFLLFVLVPVRDEMHERIAAQKPDQLSLTYLQLAVHEAPRDPALRLLLARQYHEMTRYDDAMRTLAPLLSDRSTYGHQARLLAIEIQHARCTGGKVAPPPGCSLKLARDVRALLDSEEMLSAAELERLAEVSTANQAPGLAGDLYSRLAEITSDSEERVKWREVAASSYLEGERPANAAAMHVKTAREQPPTRAEIHVDRALDHLREAERADDALALALAELERAPESRRLLERAVALALENELAELAAQLGRRLVAASDIDDTELLSRQLALELGVGELERALELARRLAELMPDNVAAHQQLAYIADWAGKPLIALDEWAWLARRVPDRSYRDRALTLARAQWDQERLLELTLPIARGDRARQVEVATLYMLLGRPGEALAVLGRVISAYPDYRPAWDELINVHQSRADYTSVAETWQRIHARFGIVPRDAVAWAEALWRARRPEEALQVLQDSVAMLSTACLPTTSASNRRTVPAPMCVGSESELLHMMAELSWQLEELDTARWAHEVLWRQGIATWTEVERLIIAARETGAVDLALYVAKGAWQQRGKPEAILRAMQIAFDAGRWKEMALLEEIASRGNAIQSLADYWQLRTARRQQSLRVALDNDALDDAQSMLTELERELTRAGNSSREFANRDDYRALWSDWYVQQLYVALRRNDFATAEKVLDRAREQLSDAAEYWRLRLMLRQRRLNKAVEHGDADRAGAILQEMATDLDKARQDGLAQHPAIQTLSDDMNRQVFYLAVARGDVEVAGRMLDTVDVPPMDRARVLEQLGRYERAVSAAIEAGVQDGNRARVEDRRALEELTHRRPRYVAGRSRVLLFDQVELVQAGPEVEYTWNRYGIKATATASHIDTESGVADEVELRMAGQWFTPRSVSLFSLGANMRPGDPRIQFDAAHSHYLRSALQVALTGGYNQTTEESGVLRFLAVRDYASLRMSLDVKQRLFAMGQIAGSRYRHRGGDRVGSSADVSLSAGYRLSHLPLDWNVRLVGRTFLPWRGPAEQCERLLPERSQLVAAAMTIANGQPGLITTPVSRLRYSLDVLAGWLTPYDRFAYSVVFGMGIPIWGSDELSIAAELANATPFGESLSSGGARRGITIRYARTLW